MSKRLPLFVLLASALTFLASLFLPWRKTVAPPAGSSLRDLLNHFSGAGRTVDGWAGAAGDIAVLLVVALVLAILVALRRPKLAARLPIGGLGVALGYFAAAVAVEVHTLTDTLVAPYTGHPERPPAAYTSWTYGFYLGLASAGIAVLGALVFRRGALRRSRGVADGVAVALGIALLVSFLLPWEGVRRVSISVHGIESAPAAIGALVLILGAGRLYGEAGRRWRLPLVIAIAILTGAAAGSFGPFLLHRYGTWVGVGCAAALVALEAVRAWPVSLPVLPRGRAAVRLGAAALLIVSLFLPWQEFPDAGGQGLDGWYSTPGAAAGSLCLVLLAAPALPALESYARDAIFAVAIFVSVAGTAFREDSLSIGYGAFVGFAGAGILLGTAFVELRGGRVDRQRALARAVPLAVCVLCVAAAVMPLWFVLPESWWFQASALNRWFAVPGVLLALYLLHWWALRVRGPARTGYRLTLVPLVLLTLPALQLIRYRSEIIWGGVILVGLCLVLAVFGRIEERGGLESLRVPEEIWRVDRLPEAEA